MSYNIDITNKKEGNKMNVIRINPDNSVKIENLTYRQMDRTFSSMEVNPLYNGLYIAEESEYTGSFYNNPMNEAYKKITTVDDEFHSHFFIVRLNDVDEYIDVDAYDIELILSLLK